MQFSSAKEVLKKNLHLIGKNHKEGIIDELILVPSDNKLTEKFLKIYLQCLNGEEAITPFVGVDVNVVAIFNKEYIINHGVILHTSITNLPSELGVIT